jgi:hypothetical protein
MAILRTVALVITVNTVYCSRRWTAFEGVFLHRRWPVALHSFTLSFDMVTLASNYSSHAVLCCGVVLFIDIIDCIVLDYKC